MISKISEAINNSIECSAHFGRDPKQLVKLKKKYLYMQDYFPLRRRNLFPLFFVSLLLFVCFCLSPKKVMHRCDRGERGAERQAKLFYHSDTNFRRCLFIIMRLLASFIIRNSEANTDFVPGSTFERYPS